MLNDHNPKFGKNIIENLSEGMYDNPLFLFREYVQNAADAIDAAEKQGVLKLGTGEIIITIDPSKRLISFEDNGTGICRSEVLKMLANIGDSQKDRKFDKGFRGIGRLGGLGYCHTVRFETSVAGEDILSTLEWDAKTLHDIFNDKNNHMDASEVIKVITTVSTQKCDKASHFFKVSMIGVNSNSDELLDSEEVRKYLAMVAPVPFDYARFRFVGKIENFLADNNLPKPCEYQIFLNGDELRKGYTTPLKIEDKKAIDILDVECRTILSNDKIIGWYWFCVSRFEGYLSKKCWQRGMRLRKANIQIGEADCLSNHPRRGIPLWKEDRGNNYFLGEVHALDENLTPNSRRDYFNQDDACRRFENALSKSFMELDKLYHDASKLRSGASKIQAAHIARSEFEAKDKAGAFLDAHTREQAKKEVEVLEATGKAAQKEIEKIYNKAQSGAIAKVADEYMPEVINAYDKINVCPFTPQETPSKGYAKDNIPAEVKATLDTVFEVIDKLLPPEQSKPLKEAIVRRFIK